MNRNVLYLVIGMLIVAGGVMGYQLYQDRHKTEGVEIDLGKNGLSIQPK
jgi:predicted negative regulator of RcsB-dependent stress response